MSTMPALQRIIKGIFYMEEDEKQLQTQGVRKE
jgi:hypothetical protein